MAEHTLEPWKASRMFRWGDQSRTVFWSIDREGSSPNPRGALAFVWGRLDDPSEGEANARRVVACVNALAGWPTGLLREPAALAALARLRDELTVKKEELSDKVHG